MLEEARNEAGLSLERAAELTFWDRKALRRRETGEIPVVPEEVCKLAEVYHYPLLKHWYCSVCAIGKEKGHCFEPIDATVAMIRFFKGFECLPEVKNNLMDILEDGQITEDEIPLFNDVCDKLDYLKRSIHALEMQKEKIHRANDGHSVRL